MSRQIQIVEMSEYILEYYKREMDFSSEPEAYRTIALEEFKYKLEESLNCGVATKKIRWVK